MTRLALLAVALSACIDPEPELIWNVEVTSAELVVGESTTAHSSESLPSGESPMPLVASWYALPEGMIELSSDVGSTISVAALVPGNVMLYASAGGAQFGVERRVELTILAP